MVPQAGLVPHAEHEERAVMPVGPHAIEPQIGKGPNAGHGGHAVNPVGPHVLVPHVIVPQAGLVPDAGHGGHAVKPSSMVVHVRAWPWWRAESESHKLRPSGSNSTGSKGLASQAVWKSALKAASLDWGLSTAWPMAEMASSMNKDLALEREDLNEEEVCEPSELPAC
jgi:hypothetical protein